MYMCHNCIQHIIIRLPVLPRLKENDDWLARFAIEHEWGPIFGFQLQANHRRSDIFEHRRTEHDVLNVRELELNSTPSTHIANCRNLLHHSPPERNINTTNEQVRQDKQVKLRQSTD